MRVRLRVCLRVCSLTRTGKTSLGYLQSPRSLGSGPLSTSLSRFSGTLPRPMHPRYGSVNPGLTQAGVCLWQFTKFCFVLAFCCFVFIFEIGSHCGGLHGLKLTEIHLLHSLRSQCWDRRKALLFCSFEVGSHCIPLADTELNMDVIHQAGLRV